MLNSNHKHSRGWSRRQSVAQTHSTEQQHLRGLKEACHVLHMPSPLFLFRTSLPKQGMPAYNFDIG